MRVLLECAWSSKRPDAGGGREFQPILGVGGCPALLSKALSYILYCGVH